jgi:inositol phosphorylceramide mannosyltransferase catalytic subunit
LELRIPKRIIQTGKDLDLSLLSRAAVSTIRLLNPDFEYLFFTDTQVVEFIEDNFKDYRKVFHSFKYPIQRYDLFRYLAIYHLGGFYFDLDVFLAVGLNDLLEFGCVFPFEELTISVFLREKYGLDWEVGNYAFGAAPGHPFIKAVIDNCVRAQIDPGWVQPMMAPIPRLFRDEFIVLNTTGPGLVTRTLTENPEAAKEVKILFPQNVLEFKNSHCFGAFGVHLQAGGWRNHKSFAYRWLARNWESWKRKKLLEDSIELGETRSLELLRK